MTRMRTMRPFINTNELKREGLNFLKNGYYTDAPRGTKDYYDYWLEQQRRCIEGYSVGGLRITGYHYFYLNYNQILLVPQSEIIEGLQLEGMVNNRRATKIQTFPAFWDGDYEYFWAVDIARNGISEEEYKALGLETEILNINGGFHLVVLKARGKGYSYKAASMLAKNYGMGRNSKNYAIAEQNTYLIEDGLLNKTWDTISFVDMNTPWAQPRVKDTLLHKKAGYKIHTDTGPVETGRLNEVIGISLMDDPNKARGKRGELVFYEEAGKFTNLLKAWEINKPSFEQGAIKTGLMISFGTGGSTEEAQSGLEELFYNPEANGIMPFNNIWDDGTDGTACGFFVPAYQNMEGFMDIDGNSNEEAAREYILKEREVKKKSPNAKILTQYVQENPITPQEAMMSTTINQFPVIELDAQRNRVKRDKLHDIFTNCILYEGEEGKIKIHVGPEVPPPIIQFPHKRGDDVRGCVQILESPVNIEGQVPENLYIIVHDPYDTDQVKDGPGSLGVAYVIKLWNNFSTSYMGCIVASYVGRPSTRDDYNDQLFKLSKFYNAKIGYESNRGNVLDYARQHKLMHLLAPAPASASNKAHFTPSGYGQTMTEGLKDVSEIYVRDWLNHTIATDSEGNEIKLTQTIYDLSLLEELIKFNRKKGNFDRVSALMVGMFFIEDRRRADNVPTIRKKEHSDFFDRLYSSV